MRFHKYATAVIAGQLRERGWKLSAGQQYNGIRMNHRVTCLRCQHTHIKRLDNLIYRDEPCPYCGNSHAPRLTQQQAAEQMEAVCDRLAALEAKVDRLSQPTIAQAVNPTVTHECERLFRKLVSKRGYRKYKRNMTRQEWLITELAVGSTMMGYLGQDVGESTAWAQEFDRLHRLDKSRRTESILFTIIPADKHQQALEYLRIQVVKT